LAAAVRTLIKQAPTKINSDALHERATVREIAKEMQARQDGLETAVETAGEVIEKEVAPMTTAAKVARRGVTPVPAISAVGRVEAGPTPTADRTLTVVLAPTNNSEAHAQR
jgi:hypothetical protein